MKHNVTSVNNGDPTLTGIKQLWHAVEAVCNVPACMFEKIDCNPHGTGYVPVSSLLEHLGRTLLNRAAAVATYEAVQIQSEACV